VQHTLLLLLVMDHALGRKSQSQSGQGFFGRPIKQRFNVHLGILW
jgi:hypothetical protein